MENIKTISRPYATAVFEFCLEQKESEYALNFWDLFLKSSAEALQSKPGQELLAQHKDYQPYLTKFLLEVLPQELMTQEVKNFLSVVEDNSRYEYLQGIYDFFIELRRKYDLPTPVTVISAKELNAEQHKKVGVKVATKLKRKVKLNVVVDPSILSGIIIRTDDFQIDCSGRKNLENLSAYMKK